MGSLELHTKELENSVRVLQLQLEEAKASIKALTQVGRRASAARASSVEASGSG